MLVLVLLVVAGIGYAVGGGLPHAVALSTTLTPPDSTPPVLVPVKMNYFHVNGGTLLIKYVDSDILWVKCQSGAVGALDNATLPAAQQATRVRHVIVLECQPPSARSYATVLSQLRVALAPGGTLELELPRGDRPLGRGHLDHLLLGNLTLRGRAATAPPAPTTDLLAGQTELRRLEVRDVPLPEEALAASLPALTSLLLAGLGPKRVPAALLLRLQVLTAGPGLRFDRVLPKLQWVSLKLAPHEEPPAWHRFPNVSTVALNSWSAAHPSAWVGCGALTSLTLTNPAFVTLPARWLAACPLLQSLNLMSATKLQGQLPEALLQGACDTCQLSALTSMSLRFSYLLAELPQKLFDPVPNLRSLDLMGTRLKTLPGGIFMSLRQLVKLNLSRNKLEKDVYFVLKSLSKLRRLDLSDNRDLGDACPGGRVLASEDSLLKGMQQLDFLDLSYTNVTRVCRDWRFMPRLHLLLLHGTRITSLSYADLQFQRKVNGTRMELRNTNVTTILYLAEEEEMALRAVSDPTVTVVLTMPLSCDCNLYRFARVLQQRPEHVLLLGDVKCAGTPWLVQRAPLEDMLCAAPGLCPGAPAQCVCSARDLGSERRWRVRVACERAALVTVPALRAPDGYAVEWDLRLAGNHIREVGALPAGLRVLDLRNCSVEHASAGAVAALTGLQALRLAGNPLHCGCSAAPLLQAVAALAHSSHDALDRAHCNDSRPVLEAAAALSCPAPPAAWRGPLAWGLGVALLVLGGGVLALAGVLMQPTRRAWLKGLLLRWGWLPRGEEPEDARRPYDVFLSFAHADTAAARALAARLEAEGWRLCLHSRDWAPGEYIDAQIAASVRCARRTLALVSRQWAASRWARVELREALAAGAREGLPRLVVVLLEEEGALRPDRELRRCLATCTYLRADHPRFWDRLCDALPPPRLAPAPAPAPQPSPAAAA